MSTITTGQMTQLTFSWGESDDSQVAVVAPSKVAFGVAVPERQRANTPPVSTKTTQAPASASKTSSMIAPEVPRRGRPEHISDLLLVVLDRYGIDPEEFLAGLK